MTGSTKSRIYRFGVFEADATTGELRKQGVRVKLNMQPFQVLLMLLARPGEVLTREEVARELWPEGTFVDYEHGVNSAVNRIRDAVGDTAKNPRFIETLARRGYRFVAPVQQINQPEEVLKPAAQSSPIREASTPMEEPEYRSRFLASPHELPEASYRTVQTLFVLLQLMYLGFYVGALANLGEVEELLSPLSKPVEVLILLVATAALLIPVRIFLFSAVLFHAPELRRKFLRMWPFLLPFDVLWSLSPFLLLHHISAGLALACIPPLIYAPFAQRSLILMGAGIRSAQV